MLKELRCYKQFIRQSISQFWSKLYIITLIKKTFKVQNDYNQITYYNFKMKKTFGWHAQCFDMFSEYSWLQKELTISCDGEVMCAEAILDVREIEGCVSQKMIFGAPINT